MKFIDYYKVLGLEMDASAEDIKKSFRKLAKLYHPDATVNKTEEEKRIATLKLKEVYEAYNVLKDDIKRIEYDKLYYKHLQVEKKKEKEQVKEEKNKSLKAIYKEVRKEEKANSFSKRHSNFTRNLDNYFSTNNEKLISFEKGLLHICAETIYQFSKLSKKEDGKVKYILRNRYLLSTTLACFLALGAFNKKSDIRDFHITYTLDEVNSTVDLVRFYTVKKGDTLSNLAEDTNVPIHMIKKVNNKYNDNLTVGESLILHYQIPVSDLKYYTYCVSYDKNLSLAEFASKYNTTIDNLISINEAAITNDNGVYVVLSDNLYVPKYITKEELREKKALQKNL